MTIYSDRNASLSDVVYAAGRGAVVGGIVGATGGLAASAAGGLGISGAGAVAAGMAGAAAGDYVGQLAGWKMDQEFGRGPTTGMFWSDSYRWEQTVGAAVGTAAGAGVARVVGVSAAAQPSCAATFGRAALDQGARMATGVAGGLAGDAVSQGLAIAGGRQAEWDWAQTVGAAAGGAAGGLLEYRLSRACFAAGTPLLTPGGWRAVEAFRPGDAVLSRDEGDPAGAVGPRAVEAVFARHAAVWDLRAGGRAVRTTAEHPFYARGRGWVECRALAAGDELLSAGGGWVRVDGVVDTGAWEAVYNLRVADWHTYFVGTDDWGFSLRAHNSNGCTDAAYATRNSLEADTPYQRMIAELRAREQTATAYSTEHALATVGAYQRLKGRYEVDNRTPSNLSYGEYGVTSEPVQNGCR